MEQFIRHDGLYDRSVPSGILPGSEVLQRKLLNGAKSMGFSQIIDAVWELSFDINRCSLPLSKALYMAVTVSLPKKEAVPGNRCKSSSKPTNVLL